MHCGDWAKGSHCYFVVYKMCKELRALVGQTLFPGSFSFPQKDHFLKERWKNGESLATMLNSIKCSYVARFIERSIKEITSLVPCIVELY